MGKLLRRFKNLCQTLCKKSRLFNRVFHILYAWYNRLRYRAVYKRCPVDDKTMVFTAFQGRRYACSPRAIYETLLKDPHYDDYTFVWAFTDPGCAAEFPPLQRAVLVLYHSKAHLEYLAGAKVWISNMRVYPEIIKKPGQIYVQTWHGSPFKRLGFDLEIETKHAQHTNKDFERFYTKDALLFDYLVTQSPFCTEKMSSGFNLPGCNRTHTLLETGYPRNDFLINHTPRDAEQARAKHNIPEGKRVILYAPTWRDDRHQTGLGFTYSIGDEFDYLSEHLPDDTVILFRAHYFIANSFDFAKYKGFVRNVSEEQDINTLFIISDILITDYSSVFFDYANLCRPILFYMYDRQHYAENLRGFWLSLEELPGPCVETVQALCQSILDIDRIREAYRERYQAFNARCNALDDGHAAERVIKAFTGRSC